jgi:GTP-binding protein
LNFVDEVTITVESGKGGSGCVSFRREKFIPKGGPDGGDGGRGGDVVLVVSAEKNTLHHFRNKTRFKAPNGRNGAGKNRFGKDGEDLIIPVPPGTLVRDGDSREVLKDLVTPGERYVAARGGQGGKGNAHFKTATHQSPKFAQPGGSGETRTLRLELKLIADVGIVGLPNAGKSTLIRAISAAKPKVADYPFTTLFPHLGVVTPEGGDPFLVADIPGLVEGAHKGTGLGIQFLKHIERTRVLVHLIDATAVDPSHPIASYEAVNRELAAYNPSLPGKKQLVVLNKMDLPGAESSAEAFEAAVRPIRPIRVSAATGWGIEILKARIGQLQQETSA